MGKMWRNGFRTCNRCEIEAYKEFVSQGYEVVKNGYPDFILVNWKTKEVRFVEIKPEGKRLKPRQIKTKRIFELAGLNYEVKYIKCNGVVPRSEASKLLKEENESNTSRIKKL